MINLRIVAVIFGLATIIGSAPCGAQSKPTHCAGVATERLPECGWTESKQRAIDAEEARASDDRARSARATLRRMLRECDDKPLGKMTMGELEDCNKPGMRMLRDLDLIR